MIEPKWQLLTGSSKQKAFSRGTVFRCNGKYPYEKLVDFLLINDPDSPAGHTLVVATGYKSGHILISLPAEAKTKNSAGISRKWLIDNWNLWVYEIGPENVYFKENYTIDEFWVPDSA